ncbi:MAG TPA: histidine phosphatase family protein, partial [candidate division Zixibacteria bacterium]|nr:histidine phosphatase family protein [candidate division Zixibacteria bacterium]
MGNSSTKIFLVRHGETASNVENRFRGRADIPLSENGFAQVHELADELRNVPFAAIYSSPLSRALQTAEAIAMKRSLGVVSHHGFNNLDIGDWTDRPKAEIQREYPELWERWTSAPERMQIPGGETIEAVRARAFNALQSLVEAHKGEAFAVVTHRAVLKPLMSAMLGIPEPFFWKFRITTASYSVFEHGKNGYM